MLCVGGGVRIAGGDGLTYGHVEVCISGLWRSVCSDVFWGNTDAGVVCRQLGFHQYGMFSYISCMIKNEKRGKQYDRL